MLFDATVWVIQCETISAIISHFLILLGLVVAAGDPLISVINLPFLVKVKSIFSSNSNFSISLSKLFRYWKMSSFKYDITLKIIQSQIPSYNQ